MEILFGLLVIGIGSFFQSSSYVPINKVKNWSWESFWLVQGIFAWIVFPLLGISLVSWNGDSFMSLFLTPEALKAIAYGVLWGIGGLTFGLSMRYLGVALGQSLSLGTCAAFGTLFPSVMSGKNLFAGEGAVLLSGVLVTLLGIVVIGYAGALRSADTDGKKSNIKEFYLVKGIVVALLAGLMSACFALGLESGVPLKERLVESGVPEFYAGLPIIFFVTLGGFLTNIAYCLQQNIKNRTGKEYFSVSGKVFFRNLMFCALAGFLWYSQFFCLEIGKSFLGSSPVLLAFSWSILMALNVLFSNLWGIILKEWKGCSVKTVSVLVAGLLILVFSIILVAIIQK